MEKAARLAVLAGFTLALALPLPAQAPDAAKPRIQVNFLNSCRPSEGDAAAMTRALELVQYAPEFTRDFEVARGITSLGAEQARAEGVAAGTPSSWVRIRREFPEKAALSVAEYSLSIAGGEASEVMALHLRENSEALQILISSSGTHGAGELAAGGQGAERIRIERYGRPSIVLARCPAVDQSAYVTLFARGGEILQSYKKAMSVSRLVPAELERLRGQESKSRAANRK